MTMESPQQSSAQLTGIQWVVFDVVGTLLFADPPLHMAYHRIGKRFGSTVTPVEARERFELAMRECRLREADTEETPSKPTAALRKSGTTSWQTSEEDEREFWSRVVERVLPDVSDRSGCFDELFDHFAKPGSWQCFMDVEETLPLLQQRGVQCALASNFDHRLHTVCAGLPALEAISTRLVASEVGYRKPAPEFYAALVAACGDERSSILMVGDSLEEDVAAPRRYGLAALHLDRSGQGAGDIRSLSELLQRLV